MTPEKILGIDMSTKTGWSSMVSTEEGIVLESYGTIPAIHQPDGVYPSVFVDWAQLVFDEIKILIDRFHPDILVIEETCAGSKAVYTQKILEFCHYLLAKYIKESKIKSIYLLTGAWRSEVGAKMTREESAHNKYVRDYKKKNKSKRAYDINGKLVGLKTKKHINVRRANEIFGSFLKTPLRKKDEDTADSLLLGYTWHLRRLKKEDGTKEVSMEDLIKGTI